MKFRNRQETPEKANNLERRKVLKMLGLFPIAFALKPNLLLGRDAHLPEGDTPNLDNGDSLEQLRLENGIILTNIPESGVTPRRKAGLEDFSDNPNTTGIEGTAFMLAEGGVLGVYDFNEASRNPSATHMTGRNETTLIDANRTPQALALPANGFTEITCAYATLSVGDRTLNLPDQGPDHSYVVEVQGHQSDNKQNTDASDTITVSNYKPGHTGVKEMGVNLGAGSFRSQEDVLKAVVAAHGKSQTSRGNEGTSRVTLVLWAVDENALTITESSHATDTPKTIEISDLNNWTKQFQNWS